MTNEELEELELGASNAPSPFMHAPDNGWVVRINSEKHYWIPMDHRGPDSRRTAVTMMDISNVVYWTSFSFSTCTMIKYRQRNDETSP